MVKPLSSTRQTTPAKGWPNLISLGHGVIAALGQTEVETAPGEFSAPLTGEFASDGTANRASWTWRYAEGLSVRHEFSPLPGGGMRIAATLVNESPARLALTGIHCHRATRFSTPRPLDKVYTHADAMCGFSGLQTAPETFKTWGVCGFTNATGDLATVFGFEKFEAFLGEIEGDCSGGGWCATAQCRFGGMQLQPGQVMELPALLLFAGTSLDGLLGRYAGAVGHVMGARPHSSAPTGWCSWYHYFGHETESDLLARLDEVACAGLMGKGPVFQVDDGWNLPQPGHPRVWGDWFPGAKFPHGMKWMAERIRERGFTPGLWLAPFSVDAASLLAQKHPEWMVQKRDETTGTLRPAGIGKNDQAHALDLTQPAVIAFIRETFHRVFHEWGFGYVKIDFLVQALTPGLRADPSITPVQAFRRGLAAIREDAGDEGWILGCGCPIGPAIGFCDSMRVGFDVGGGWDPPVVLPDWPNGNCCVKAAAVPAYYRHWMHRRWWQNDPDCLIVRGTPVEWEIAEMDIVKKRLPAPSRPGKLYLTDDEAECWVRLVWMLGDAAFFSEIWPALPPSRQEVLSCAFPPNPEPAAWVDWYQDPEVCLLRTGGERLLVGVFNLSDEPKRVVLPGAKLNLRQWRFTELWTEETFSGEGASLEFPELPPHSGRIWRLTA